ncbi:hypothetical protein HDV00_005567 [Rhizophlyctis rosea]|nr:hypothetical protein HDV00_005567 [Rhizophlyctis rosea]
MAQSTIRLKNSGVDIPVVGLGVWQAKPEETVRAVTFALKEVGEGIRLSGIPRSEIFVTTKVWNPDQGYEQTLAALETSLRKLGLEHVDLYLM